MTLGNGVDFGRHHRRGSKSLQSQRELRSAHGNGNDAMLLVQAATPPLFEQKCSGCHKSAAEFVGESIVQKDGVLLGRSNKLPLSEYLQKHGRLHADEVGTVVESLIRIFDEIQKNVKK